MIKETIEQIQAAEQRAKEKEEQTLQMIANEKKDQQKKIAQQWQDMEQRLCEFQQQEKEKREQAFRSQYEILTQDYEAATKQLAATYEGRLANVQTCMWEEVQKIYGHCQDGKTDRHCAE